jgi:hypothetical protein
MPFRGLANGAIQGTSRCSIEVRRAQTAKASAAWPPLAVRAEKGGAASAEWYAEASPEVRARHHNRIVLGTIRFRARKAGYPAPLEFLMLPDGSSRPMTESDYHVLGLSPPPPPPPPPPVESDAPEEGSAG